MTKNKTAQKPKKNLRSKTCKLCGANCSKVAYQQNQGYCTHKCRRHNALLNKFEKILEEKL